MIRKRKNAKSKLYVVVESIVENHSQEQNIRNRNHDSQQVGCHLISQCLVMLCVRGMVDS